MMVTFGKTIMVLVWLAILTAPLSPLADYWPWLWFGGALLLLIHGVQALAIRLALKDGPLWRDGDGWQLLFFGFFALLKIKGRSSS